MDERIDTLNDDLAQLAESGMADSFRDESINTSPEQTEARITRQRKAAQARGKKAVAKKVQTLGRLSVEYVPIDSVFPNEYNPNRQSDHDFELLVKSMEEDGFTTPIICIRESRKIVDGEHRWRAAHVLGYKEIPVVFVSMNDEQARIATIRHNRARGAHDIYLEADVLRDLQQLGALDWAKDSLSMDDVELNRLLTDFKAEDAFATKEYTQAWVPGELAAELESVDSRIYASASGSDTMDALTHDALELKRQREDLLARAKTAQERNQAIIDTSVFRLQLTVSGDEAEVVKRVLGHRPAVRLVELCRAADGTGSNA